MTPSATALTDRVAVLQERVAADRCYAERLREQVKRDAVLLRHLADLIRRPQHLSGQMELPDSAAC